jgi:carboxypeptidase Taq
MNAYRELEGRFRRVATVEEAIAVLQWDTAAVMPSGGAETRAEQSAVLRGIAHRLLSDPAIAELLDEAERQRNALDEWQSANLREMRRRWRHATALPSDLVEARSRARSHCETVWREARPADDFAMVLPALRRHLAVECEVASRKAEVFGVSPYEALLDQNEPGMATATIDRLFAEIARFLPDLIENALARQARRPPTPEPRGPFPVETQRQVAMGLMQRIGFDFAHGRLDVSAHPFCGGTEDDVRITTRYDERDFVQALMGVLHETGHALYKRGLPAEWRRQPVGAARGMAMHESQSLLLEMQVCRSRAFLGFAAPILKAAFGGEGPGWEADALYRRYTRVSRSLIRVEADEVTYPAHVILRYRLERAMLAGDLDPADLPGAWAEAMRELLGIVPPNDREGCLQDIHWYDGAWAYFPTYTLGAMIAAQLFQAAQREVPGLPDAIAAGDFVPLFAWLRRAVHARGSLLTTAELVEQATGTPLGTECFERHLRSRYLA